MTLLFDPERYDELIKRLKNHNAILGGFETISELQQLLEEIEGESAWDSYVASFYSYWQWKARFYPVKISPKLENGDPT